MNNTLLVISAAADLLAVAIELQAKLQQVSLLLQKARTEGRDITDEELDSIRKLDDEARLKLDVAIAKGV